MRIGAWKAKLYLNKIVTKTKQTKATKHVINSSRTRQGQNGRGWSCILRDGEETLHHIGRPWPQELRAEHDRRRFPSWPGSPCKFHSDSDFFYWFSRQVITQGSRYRAEFIIRTLTIHISNLNSEGLFLERISRKFIFIILGHFGQKRRVRNRLWTRRSNPWARHVGQDCRCQKYGRPHQQNGRPNRQLGRGTVRNLPHFVLLGFIYA